MVKAGLRESSSPVIEAVIGWKASVPGVMNRGSLNTPSLNGTEV